MHCAQCSHCVHIFLTLRSFGHVTNSVQFVNPAHGRVAVLTAALPLGCGWSLAYNWKGMVVS